jgi:hypothetical protein
MKLYEITAAMERLCDAEEEFDDTALALISQELEKKTDSISVLLKSISSDVEQIKAEEVRLATKRKALENRERQIKEYVLHQMKVHNIEKFKGSLFTITRQKNAASLVIDDESQLPARFYDIIPETKVVNKARVKDILATGVKLAGAHLETGEHLRVR